MSSVNKVILVGNLGSDPEAKTTPGGKAVTSFSVATSEKFTDRNGQTQERTEWHKIEAWDKLAELCARFLKKGSKVYLEGKIRTDKVGEGSEAKYYTKINASAVTFLDSAPRDGQSAGGGGQRAPYGGGSQRQQAPSNAPAFDDDVPF